MANPLNFLIEDSKDPRRDGWYWATVTQADPLRIRLDNEPLALPYTPESLISYAAVGDRVRVVIVDRQPTIVGNTNNGDTDWLPIPAIGDFTSAGSVRRIGGILYFRGTLNGSLAANTTTPAGTSPLLHSGFIRVVSSATTSGYPIGYMGFNTSGQITVRHTSAISGNISLSPLSGTAI